MISTFTAEDALSWLHLYVQNYVHMSLWAWLALFAHSSGEAQAMRTQRTQLYYTQRCVSPLPVPTWQLHEGGTLFSSFVLRRSLTHPQSPDLNPIIQL